jgi:hypothetical protein
MNSDQREFQKNKNIVRIWGVIAVGLVLGLNAAPVGAQGEKRTVFTQNDFHWQGDLKPGQTLEVVNRNGEITAAGAADATTKVEGSRQGMEDSDLFFEVVEYPDGVTICAVYARDKAPGRCHKGGVSGDWTRGLLGRQTKVVLGVQVSKGVQLHALTTNGNIHARELNSVVEASTTNGNVEVSTSEWASATTTNGSVRVAMGKAAWSGELKMHSTNGSVNVTLPASAEFAVRAETTNGGIHTEFPILVEGSRNSKELSGKVGTGGRELKLTTTNGGIEIKKS